MTKENIESALKGVNYPGFTKDIVTFGFVKDIVGRYSYLLKNSHAAFSVH